MADCIVLFEVKLLSVAEGTFTLLAPSATDSTSLSVGVDTTNAGNKRGSVTINFESDGTGTSGLGITQLSSRTIDVVGTVYRFANPSPVTPATVDFGILHVGDPATAALTITNVGPFFPDGFTENLRASFGGTTGEATASGSFFLEPRTTDDHSLVIGVDTSTPGFKHGTATIAQESDGTQINGLGRTPLPSQFVTVSAQVNAFAEPLLAKLQGDGTLTQVDATHFALDMGTILEGESRTLITELALSNAADIPGDELAGQWSLDTADFNVLGFHKFSRLQPGESLTDLLIQLVNADLGIFTGQITLQSASENSTGFSAGLSDVMLTIRATRVIPEPSAWKLLLVAMVALWCRRRGRGARTMADVAR